MNRKVATLLTLLALLASPGQAACVPTSFFDYFGVTSYTSPTSSFKNVCPSTFNRAGACVDSQSLIYFLESNARSINTDFLYRTNQIATNFTQFMTNLTNICRRIIYSPSDFYDRNQNHPTPHMLDLCHILLRYSAIQNQLQAGFMVEYNTRSCISYYLQVMAGAYCILASGEGTNNFYVDFSSFYLGVTPDTSVKACSVCGYTLVVNCLVSLLHHVYDSYQRSTSDLDLQNSCNNIDLLWGSLVSRTSLNSTFAAPLFQTFFKINRFSFAGSDFESAFEKMTSLQHSLGGRRLISATFGFQFKVTENGTDPWTIGVNSKLSFVNLESRLGGTWMTVGILGLLGWRSGSF
jgi:hypothetical protein